VQLTQGSVSAAFTSARPTARCDALFRWLALEQSLLTHPRPLALIVEKLAGTLDVDVAFVGETVEDAPETVRTLAWGKDGRHVENVEYGAAGTPCALALHGRAACYPENVTELFPRVGLRADGMQAYAAHPLVSTSGDPLGLVAVVSRTSFADPPLIRRVLRDLAPRLAGEIERVRLEESRRVGLLWELSEAQQREERLLDSLRERDTALREVHHRVKNNLQVVSSLLALQADSSSDPVIVRLLSGARTRVSTIALIHTTLCQNPTASTVDMNRFLQNLVDNVRRTFADLTSGVTVQARLDPLTLPLRWATPCGLLISELLTNAFKHAFADARKGTIDIRLSVQGDEVTIVVRDDGRGLPNDAALAEGGGIGLPLIRLLATRQLRGALSIDRTGGTAFTVRFSPLSQPATS